MNHKYLLRNSFDQNSKVTFIELSKGLDAYTLE